MICPSREPLKISRPPQEWGGRLVLPQPLRAAPVAMNITLFLEIVDPVVVHFLAVGVHALDLEVAVLAIQRFAELGYASYSPVTDLRDDKTGTHIGLIAEDAVLDVTDDYATVKTESCGIVLAQIGEIGPE